MICEVSWVYIRKLLYLLIVFFVYIRKYVYYLIFIEIERKNSNIYIIFLNIFEKKVIVFYVRKLFLFDYLKFLWDDKCECYEEFMFKRVF